MAQSAAGAAGPVDPQVVALIEGVSDERVAVAAANVRFEAALARSDLLSDDDSSAAAKRIREKNSGRRSEAFRSPRPVVGSQRSSGILWSCDPRSFGCRDGWYSKRQDR